MPKPYDLIDGVNILEIIIKMEILHYSLKKKDYLKNSWHVFFR